MVSPVDNMTGDPGLVVDVRCVLETAAPETPQDVREGDSSFNEKPISISDTPPAPRQAISIFHPLKDQA